MLSLLKYMYLSSLIEPIASITTLPSHPLPPLRQIFLLRLPVEIDLSLQPNPQFRKFKEWWNPSRRPLPRAYQT